MQIIATIGMIRINAITVFMVLMAKIKKPLTPEGVRGSIR
jgi:hypothetical protein